MSLNVGCYHAIVELSESIRENCNVHESREYISGIVDAMFALAEIAVKIELRRREISKDATLMESRVVLSSLLRDVDDYTPLENEAICNQLIDLACVNTRFANALRTVAMWIETEDGQEVYADECPKYAILPSILKTAELSKLGMAA